MRSFEIFVEPQPTHTAEHWTREPASNDASVVEAPAPERRAHTAEVLDMFIHGANVTARVTETQATAVLRDLASALVELKDVRHGKKIVRFYDDAWELCVERFDEQATISVYRGGAEPSVLVYDKPVTFSDMCASVAEAVRNALSRNSKQAKSLAVDLTLVERALRSVNDASLGSATQLPEPTLVRTWLDDSDVCPVAYAAEFWMRSTTIDRTPADAQLERADLHALMVQGNLRAVIRGRTVELGEGFPFVFAERLINLSARALDAWERGQSLNCRIDAGGIMVGLRTNDDADAPTAALSIGRASAHAHTESQGAKILEFSRTKASPRHRTEAGTTFPEIPLFDLIEASILYARALCRAMMRHDRRQARNLRLTAFRREVRSLASALADATRQDGCINQAPESYRAFAECRRPASSDDVRDSGQPTRLRYAMRWKAEVPGIDLRATFLCGEHLIIGAASETFAVHRASGQLVWRKPTPRATCVVTPVGLARIGADGTITLHDYETGEATLRTWIAPRVSGPPQGAVVHSPGLPRLLIVTEGERHLVAIDLTSGEARWRYQWSTSSRPMRVKIKRFGKLIYVSSGDSALSAVDVQTGQLVWKVRDRLRFSALASVDVDQLFAVSGGSASAGTLHALNPYSGQSAWTANLASYKGFVDGAPMLTPHAVSIAIRSNRGTKLLSFDRASGAPLFAAAEEVAPNGTSWLSVDNLLIGNAPTGELVGVDATGGKVIYRHNFGQTLESDVPRRLEPVLRNGALFVPHADVHVLRPSDGKPLAKIEVSDAIADLLRVDERCDVFVAEESGHVAAFGAGPRLSLVT